MTHDDLVERAKRWLRNSMGCTVVVSERGMLEMPDAIGWKTYHGDSILVECKISTADYYRDKRKKWRRMQSAMGQRRYYMAPKGLLNPTCALEGWGLLEVEGKAARIARLVKESDRFPDTHCRSEIGLLLHNLRPCFYVEDFNNGSGI